MESSHKEDSENNKEVDNANSQQKKLSFLLLPKKDYHINKEKLNFNNDLKFDDKKFYKTSGKGFSFGRNNKKFKTNSFLNAQNLFNPKRIRSSTTDKQKFFAQKNKNGTFTNDNNIEEALQKKINELENELESKENTFVYNQKILQKRINEKESIIQKLTKKLETLTENNKKDAENNIKNIQKGYINKIKEITKENDKLKNNNNDLNFKVKECEEKITELENKNKTLVEQINELNQKYNIFIMNDEKKVFEDDLKELIKRYDDKMIEDQNEINSLNDELHYLNIENKRLKILTKEIIEGRNETEIFFLDALNEVKRDLYKLKKEKDKRGSFFPTLKKNYESNLVKVDIRALTPEMRERILRNLFEKINKGYDESKYKELNNIMAADISDDEGGY